MKQKSHITGFYVETLLMIIVFMAVILVLTNVFGLARKQTSQAKSLSAAVTLSANAAEAVASSQDVNELCAMLNTAGNAQLLSGGAGVSARYDADLEPNAEGKLRIDVTWQPENTEAGELVHSEITAWAEEEQVYQLETAVYLKDAEG